MGASIDTTTNDAKLMTINDSGANDNQ